MPANFDPSLFDSLIDQVETSATAGGGLGNVSRWVCANTRDPANSSKPFSFQNHDYQRAILDDTHPQVSVIKSTQCGMSELFYRLALAICAKFPNINVMLVLPSIGFAQKVAMSRIDPIIAASPRLRDLAAREVSSNTLKKIGSSFLHLAGAASTSSAISVPARALLLDERDFLDPTVVSTFTSRLGHQAQSERILRYFSSPLFPDVGISALFADGTQHEYLVWHQICGQWVFVDPYWHMTVPGFDEPVYNLSPPDLDNPRYQIDKAFIKCEHCGQPISTENLANPEARAWVPRYPDRENASFSANPSVLAHLRTPQVLLNDLRLYKSTVRWCQYGLGHAAESASETILTSALDRCFVVQPVPPTAAGSVYGACIGADIGKTSHVVVGKAVQMADSTHRRLEILHMTTLRQESGNELGVGIADLYRQYRAVNAVADAAPDFSTVKYLQSVLPYNTIFGAYFVRGRGKSNLESYEVVQADGVVKVARTRALDEFVAAFNAGRILLPQGLRFEEEVKKHLSRLKRVVSTDGVGEEAAQWVSTDSTDHWFFSIFYCWLAAEMSGTSTSIVQGLDLSRLIAKVKMPGGVGNPLGGNNGMAGARGLGAGFGR
mgnify:CR=1 FL=1